MNQSHDHVDTVPYLARFVEPENGFDPAQTTHSWDGGQVIPPKETGKLLTGAE